jgi:uracil-DNA glycosylase
MEGPVTDAHVDVRELIPQSASIELLRDIARGCTGCDLYKSGTQTVFGEGEVPADLMLVGEQPGDQEDRQGHPFVGPAGRLLHSALADADLREVRKYVTNVVKHFKWVERGKRRIHKKPSMGEVRACSPWLEAEIEVVRPRALVCLGATAAQALLGRDFRVTEKRGELLQSALAPVVMATVHPSSILRGDPGDRASALDAFTRDLAGVAAALR